MAAQKNTLRIACELPKSELKKVRQIINKYSNVEKDGNSLNKNLIGQDFKEKGIHYKEAFGCSSLTVFLDKMAVF